MTDHRSPDRTASGTAIAGGFAPNMVYIKPVSHDDVKDMVPEDQEIPVGPLFSVHSVDGSTLAVVQGMDTAMEAAREFGMEPLVVH